MSGVGDAEVEAAAVAYVMAGGFENGANRLGVEGEAMRAALAAVEPLIRARIGGEIAAASERWQVAALTRGGPPPAGLLTDAERAMGREAWEARERERTEYYHRGMAAAEIVVRQESWGAMRERRQREVGDE